MNLLVLDHEDELLKIQKFHPEARLHLWIPLFRMIFDMAQAEGINMNKLDIGGGFPGADQGSVGRDESSWDGPRPSSSSGRDGTRTR